MTLNKPIWKVNSFSYLENTLFSKLCFMGSSWGSTTLNYTFFILFFFFFSFFYLWWILSYIEMKQPWVYMCLPSRSPLPSLSVFPVHQVRALVSCIQPGLVICSTLDNIHVSMLFSWNIPPSPSPTESKRLFYKSVSSFFFFFSVLHIGLSLTSF